jgi:hypothetical protein
MINWNAIPSPKGVPDFNNMLQVLQGKEPSRPTLFEFFLNERLTQHLVPEIPPDPPDPRMQFRRFIRVFERLGYNYVTTAIPGFTFSDGKVQRRMEKSVSLNEGSVLHNRKDLDEFDWADPEKASFFLLSVINLRPSVTKGRRAVEHQVRGC